MKRGVTLCMALKTATAARLLLLAATAYGVMSLAALGGELARARTVKRAVENEIAALSAGDGESGAFSESSARSALGMVLPGEAIFYCVR